MRARGILAGTLVLSVALIAGRGNASKKCSDGKCNSPERCVMERYLKQQEAMASIFGSKALRAKYSDIASFTAAANKARDNLKLPSCGAGKDIETQGNVGAGTGLAFGVCETTLVYGDDNKEMPMDDVDAMGNFKPSEKMYGLATCTEILDAIVTHEKQHKAACADAKKASQPYPPTDMNTYLDDDAAAYRAGVAFLKEKLDAAPQCTPDKKKKKKKKDERDFLMKQMKSLAPKSSSSSKGAK